MILITGAAGKTGQAITKALTTRNVPVRAFVYSTKHAKRVNKLGVADVVMGDMQEAAAYRQAVEGVSAIYHICPNMNPNEVSMAQTAVAAAQEAGVKQFVYHSVLHPQTEKMPHHWHKLRVEELLFESGLNVTILQPAAYMQNILGGWQTIITEGRYQVPYPVNTRLAMVDLEDVAEAAATVLTEPGHAGAVYELAGPDAPPQSDVAEIIADVLNQPVQAEQISLEQWRQNAAAAGLGGFQMDTLTKMFRYYEQYHFLGNSNVLRWLLKREPTDFRTFVKRVKG